MKTLWLLFGVWWLCGEVKVFFQNECWGRSKWQFFKHDLKQTCVARDKAASCRSLSLTLKPPTTSTWECQHFLGCLWNIHQWRRKLVSIIFTSFLFFCTKMHLMKLPTWQFICNDGMNVCYYENHFFVDTKVITSEM